MFRLPSFDCDSRPLQRTPQYHRRLWRKIPTPRHLGWEQIVVVVVIAHPLGDIFNWFSLILCSAL